MTIIRQTPQIRTSFTIHIRTDLFKFNSKFLPHIIALTTANKDYKNNGNDCSYGGVTALILKSGGSKVTVKRRSFEMLSNVSHLVRKLMILV